MGCATSKDRVERASAVEAESFTVSTDMQKLQLQEALSKGSFLFTQERSASAEQAMPDSRPAEAAVEAAAAADGTAVEPVGTAKCTSDYESGEDIDLQLKQGDVIMIVERIDSTWLRGYVEDSPTVFGFFPANFVDEGGGTGGAEEEEEDSVAHEKRTLWVGSIPESGASVSALTAVFAAFGPLDNITVRKKETAEHGPNKSWCFVSYKSADSARSAVVETIAMEDVQLRVREPNLAAEMSKPTTGALGAIWENHKSLLGAAMKVNLQQEGDGITAGMTMGKIEKALDLVPTGHKADKTDSADLKVVARNEGSFDTKKEAKIASASFRKIKQISIDFEATRSSDFEDKKGAMEG